MEESPYVFLPHEFMQAGVFDWVAKEDIQIVEKVLICLGTTF